MITVFLVDAHEVVRRGIADLLTADPELVVIGEAASSAQALARTPVLKPDVAVLDVRLPDGNGIELCRELLSRMPALRCLMLTSIADDQAMLDAIAAGASGYVVKDFRGLELARAVHDVGAGKSLLDSRGAAALMAKLRSEANEKNGPFARLTNQERTLLALLGEGLTDRQIAERMILAENTVTNDVSRLLTKLGVARRTQAAVLATTMPPQPPRIPTAPAGIAADRLSRSEHTRTRHRDADSAMMSHFSRSARTSSRWSTPRVSREQPAP